MLVGVREVPGQPLCQKDGVQPTLVALVILEFPQARERPAEELASGEHIARVAGYDVRTQLDDFLKVIRHDSLAVSRRIRAAAIGGHDNATEQRCCRNDGHGT